MGKVKTIDIQAKEWFDRVNGNSYFAGEITVNFGLKDEQRFVMPFQYGYGDSYLQNAKSILLKKGLIDTISSYELRESGIIVNSSIKRNCLKRDLKAFI